MAARAFYAGVLGMTEVPKPPVLAASGGLWFESGEPGSAARLHLGLEADFRPAQKAHPAVVAHDVEACRAALEAAGHATRADDRIPERARFYVNDPFGNRIEVMAAE